MTGWGIFLCVTTGKCSWLNVITTTRSWITFYCLFALQKKGLMPLSGILMGMCHFHHTVLGKDKLKEYSDRVSVNFSQSLSHLHLKAPNQDPCPRSFLRGVRTHTLSVNCLYLGLGLFLFVSVCFIQPINLSAR